MRRNRFRQPLPLPLRNTRIIEPDEGSRTVHKLPVSAALGMAKREEWQKGTGRIREESVNGAWIESSKCSWLSASEDLLAKAKEQPSSTRADYFGKDGTPEIAVHNLIAAGYRGWLTEQATTRNRQEPSRTTGPGYRGRPRAPKNPERSNRSRPGAACSRAFA